uniref:Uncharacterized protein n=1 Tax=Trichuris muris TaxID=70415 RepID=A0A5S6QYF6_TRIMR
MGTLIGGRSEGRRLEKCDSAPAIAHCVHPPSLVHLFATDKAAKEAPFSRPPLVSTGCKTISPLCRLIPWSLDVLTLRRPRPGAAPAERDPQATPRATEPLAGGRGDRQSGPRWDHGRQVQSMQLKSEMSRFKLPAGTGCAVNQLAGHERMRHPADPEQESMPGVERFGCKGAVGIPKARQRDGFNRTVRQSTEAVLR